MDTTAPGDLDLRGASQLREIGPGLRVAGSLWLGGSVPRAKEQNPDRRKRDKVSAPRWGRSALAELPEGIRVEGDFHLEQCSQIKSLPETLRVRGLLSLRGLARLAHFPQGIFEGARLRITGCPGLTQLPGGWQPLEQLVLDGVNISTLPPDLQMAPGGELVLQNCARLESLPAGLTGSGLLKRIVIRDCPKLESLPDLMAQTWVVLERLGIQKIESKVEAPRVRIWRCAKLSQITAQVTTSLLTIRHCASLTQFATPVGPLKLLDVRGCSSLAFLPDGLCLKTEEYNPAMLDVTGCAALTYLPTHLTVDGAYTGQAFCLDFEGSGLREAPVYPFPWVVRIRRTRLEPSFVFSPEMVAPRDILLHQNAEVRRVLMERLGVDNLLGRIAHTILDEDRDAGGPRRLVLIQWSVPLSPPPLEPNSVSMFRSIAWLAASLVGPGLQPVRRRGASRTDADSRFLHCRCPSTGREYFLPVPPTVATCREAAAWLAGFDRAEDYAPVQET